MMPIANELRHTNSSPRTVWTTLDRQALEARQLSKLNALLECVLQRPFYRTRFAQVRLPLVSLEQLQELPLLTKTDLSVSVDGRRESSGELASGRHGLMAASIFDLPQSDYVRFHQTSGTRGRPIPVLDTLADWQWWIECWQYVLDTAQVTTGDRVMMAFSFGPFIGFWTAHDALVARGAMVIPGGGMSSEARLRLILDEQCTVLCCTPTYALHLARVAEQLSLPIASSTIRTIIVAGEPGGSIHSIRQAIEMAWNAHVVDHAGASEVGAWGVDGSEPTSTRLGLHVIESEFIAERLVFNSDGSYRSANDGELSELVLTGLGRRGGPAIRYRTGDLVRASVNHDRPCRFVFLDGGVLGRSDDMLVIRGVNIFPSSIEKIVREILGATEYRVIVTRKNALDQLEIEIEADQQQVERLMQAFRERLSMRIDVRSIAPESLPRSEGKSRRWIDRRSDLYSQNIGNP